MVKNMRCVAIISGGLDSTVMLYDLAKQGYSINALSFRYGQKHSKEIECAKWHCRELGVVHELVEIPLGKLFRSSALTNSEIEMPNAHYTHESQKVTVVPNRNMIMLAIAAGYAESIGAKELFYAAHANDEAIYPDCRPVFVNHLKETLEVGMYEAPQLIAPYVNITKAEVVTQGMKLQVPFERTWSCYQGNEKPCNFCGTCRERIESFMKNGIRDPLYTQEEWDALCMLQ